MSKGTEQVLEKLGNALDTVRVQHAAAFLMGVLVEAFGAETVKALDADLKAGNEAAFRFLYGAATQALASAQGGELPEGFAELPMVYWQEAERLKVEKQKH